jgi:hypothetical protein
VPVAVLNLVVVVGAGGKKSTRYPSIATTRVTNVRLAPRSSVAASCPEEASSSELRCLGGGGPSTERSGVVWS